MAKLHGMLIVLLLSLPATGWAQFFVWEVNGGNQKVLLPETPGEEPGVTAQRYVDFVNADPEFREILKGETLKLESPNFSSVPKGEPLFAVLANDFVHLSSPPPRGIKAVIGFLEGAGAATVVVPPGLDMFLGKRKFGKFLTDLRKKVQAMTAIGGRDIDPALYADGVRGARDFHPRLDAGEVQIIRDFLIKGRGPFFGICRGHQLNAAANGQKLIQDIPSETNGTEVHKEGWHDIQVLPGSLLHEAVGKERLSVLSYHHQAVIPNASGPLGVTAMSTDGGPEIVEAQEFKSGGGFTVQFHPEGMDNEDARAIALKMVSLARSYRKPVLCAASHRP